MLSLWRRLPVIVRAVLTGMALATVGTIPWSLLAAANLKHVPSVPWGPILAVPFLWLFWRFARGAGWPRSTAEARRTLLRANRLPGDVWGSALLAGILGLASLVLLLRVMNRLVRLPQQQPPDVSQIPALTLLCFLLVGSAVAGVVEEASYRGYMQGPIERRHGPVLAILVTGTLFGFAHFTHPEVTLILMPNYLAVAAIYGALAYLTNSIWPSMVLHAGGNLLGSIDLLTRGRTEWQASSSPVPPIWETGADASFWISGAAFLLVGAAAVWAYAALARVVRKAPEPTERA
jgi:membrane protease YdiL (CAAX protease family)